MVMEEKNGGYNSAYVHIMLLCMYVHIHVLHGPKFFVTMSVSSISVTGVHEGHEATMDAKVVQTDKIF